MSARILDFPGVPPQLQVDGYVLLAWARDATGDVFAGEGDHYHCLWKPASGKGWYESGMYYPASHSEFTGDHPGRISRGRMSRASAIESWRRNPGNPRYHWHYLCSEAQAFPAKRRRYLRPPRIGRVPSMA
jgi:hypothetical protein